jgi:hypothetical protein
MKYKKEIKKLLDLGFKQDDETMIVSFIKITEKGLYIYIRYSEEKQYKFPFTFKKTVWWLSVETDKDRYHGSRTFNDFGDLVDTVQKIFWVDEYAHTDDLIAMLFKTICNVRNPLLRNK